jgi:hypothetical protein
MLVPPQPPALSLPDAVSVRSAFSAPRKPSTPPTIHRVARLRPRRMDILPQPAYPAHSSTTLFRRPTPLQAQSFQPVPHTFRHHGGRYLAPVATPFSCAFDFQRSTVNQLWPQIAATPVPSSVYGQSGIPRSTTRGPSSSRAARGICLFFFSDHSPLVTRHFSFRVFRTLSRPERSERCIFLHFSAFFCTFLHSAENYLSLFH